MTEDTEAEIEPPFIDPVDDEDLAIIDMPGREFFRVVISDEKLSVVLTAAPCLLAVGLTARNNAAGCWVALTSRRVAERLVGTLQAYYAAVCLEVVDHLGRPVTAPSQSDLDAVYRKLTEG